MKLSLCLPTLLLLLHPSITHACLVLSGTYEGKVLCVTLTDNGRQVCAWSGIYDLDNHEQYLYCAMVREARLDIL